MCPRLRQVSYALNLAGAAALAALYLQRGRIARRLGRRPVPRRLSQFTHVPVGPGDVVLLGDSLVEDGLWGELLPGVPVRNRGVGGDLSAEVLARTRPIAEARPAAVFILVGANDLALGVPARETVDNVDEIIRLLRGTNPRVRIWIHAVPPRRRAMAESVQRLNTQLEELTRARDVGWIDLWALFDDGAGAMRPRDTSDGLHLSGSAYLTWVEVIRPLVANLERARTDREQSL